jgi:ferrochelatase
VEDATPSAPRRGLLLVNLGTPRKPEVPEVRRYLRQFLSDPRVLDTPWLVRKTVLEVLILPRRPRESAAAYRKVWGEGGSPLLSHSLDLKEQVQRKLGAAVRVELGMRYQEPSIEAALDALREQGVDQIVVFPLFPQYSSSATGSAIEEVFRVAGRRWNVPALQVVPPFYDHPSFLAAFAGRARPLLATLQPDAVLMSFHGLPERHVRKSDESGGAHCLRSPDCCERIVSANRNCYRAHCVATARGIATRLGLDSRSYEVTFQSRLGRDPWLHPYTDVRVVELARAGRRKLLVLSPAFVADCLETLEELGMRAREDFLANGGAELVLVPSLNSEEAWVDALVEIAREQSVLGVRAP